MAEVMQLGVVDPSLMGIPPQRITAHRDTWTEKVADTRWDRLAAVSGVTLPASDNPQARMEAIFEHSDARWNIRGLTAKYYKLSSVERQQLAELVGAQGKGDPTKRAPTMEELTGISGLEDKGSDNWNTFMNVGDDWNMIQPTQPRDGIRYGARLILGAANFSSLHRVQLGLGQQISVLKDDVLPASAVDPTAHPALADQSGLVLTLGSHRPVKGPELEKSRHFIAGLAPDAETTTEYAQTVGATHFALQGSGRRYTTKEMEFVNTAYPSKEGEAARMTVHDVDGGAQRIINLYAPEPAAAEHSGRAMTQHTYALARMVLGRLGALQPGDRLLNVTNSVYLPFQREAAEYEFGLREGWHVDMATLDTKQGGLPDRAPKTLLAEQHSYAYHLRRHGHAILEAERLARA